VRLKSYIETFIDCRQLNVQSVAGVKADETKKVLGPCTHRWVTGEVIPDVFSVADGILLDIYGDGDATHIFYDNSFYKSPGLNDDERFYYLERKEGYEKYIDLIGDTAYNADLRIDECPHVSAIITPLRSISITCDKSYSSQYPAGSDLNSLFTVYYDDPYSTVKNGYKSIGGSYRFWDHIIYPQSVIKEKLSKADFKESPFIGSQWLCFLDEAPEKTDEYVFQVKVTLIDGTVMEATAPPVNIKGSIISDSRFRQKIITSSNSLFSVSIYPASTACINKPFFVF
jgi:hypothetical protein